MKKLFNQNKSCKNLAFTLAEVLITLGIIGIVAALTISTLIQSYKKQVVETRLAKFYSMINQAVKMAEIDYGPQDTWLDYLITPAMDEDGNYVFDKSDQIDNLVQKYFAPYLKIVNSEDLISDNNQSVWSKRVYYFADGSAFAFPLNGLNYELYFFPKNAKKCHNSSVTYGSCLFNFVFIPGNKNIGKTKKYDTNIGGVQTSLIRWNGNDEDLMTNKETGCKDGNGSLCTEIIRRNGWKIPKDYPRKIKF